MIPWYWLIITAMLAGSFGAIITAVIIGGTRGKYLCPHGYADSDDCPDCRH